MQAPWDTCTPAGGTFYTLHVPCKKCKHDVISVCESSYSGSTYYFCRGCGTDYPDESDEEEEEKSE